MPNDPTTDFFEWHQNLQYSSGMSIQIVTSECLPKLELNLGATQASFDLSDDDMSTDEKLENPPNMVDGQQAGQVEEDVVMGGRNSTDLALFSLASPFTPEEQYLKEAPKIDMSTNEALNTSLSEHMEFQHRLEQTVRVGYKNRRYVNSTLAKASRYVGDVR